MSIAHAGTGATVLVPESVTDAFEAGKLHAVEGANDLTACLVPLLSALGWRGNARSLAEALPHFVDDLDISAFRNTLAHLNYRTRAARTRFSAIDPRLLPCLFVSRAGDPLVVLAAAEEGVVVYDGRAREERGIRGEDPAGTAYFIDAVVTDGGTGVEARGGWVGGLLRRFRRFLFQMLALTLLLDLLALAVPLFTMTVFDKVIGLESPRFLAALSLGIAFLMAVDLGLRLVRARLLAYVGGRIDNIVAAATLRQVLSLPSAYIETVPIGAQVARLTELESLREFFTGPLAGVVLELPFIAIFLLVIAAIAGPVVLVPLSFVGFFWLAALLIVPPLRRRTGETSNCRAERHSFLVEMLTNMRTIKLLGAEDIWRRRYRKLSAEAATAQRSAAGLGFLLQTVSQVLMLAAGVGTLAIGTLMVLGQTMTVGALIATMALVWRVLSPLNLGLISLVRLEQIKLSLKRINQLMRLKPEVDASKSQTMARGFAGRITFNRVAMRYRPDSEPAVFGIGFDIMPGEVIAIVGANGSGKSTILKLVAGLYHQQVGTIAIDGIDTRQLDPVELRQAVAYVPQQCELFHGTIAQNLRLAQPTASDEAIERACARAGVLAEIEALSDGFRTRIGDQRLQQLPAGFLQRLSLARAYLKETRIMLFDEPAQGLDEAGDAAFMARLAAIKGSCTMLLVTHRPSHMRLADRVLLLDGGHLVAIGTPDEILDRMAKAER